MRACLVGIVVLVACGTVARNEGNAHSDAAARDDAGGRTDAAARERPTCEPTPARCAALGGARPDRRSEHTAVYDQDRLELVVFGGTPTIPEACALGGAVRFLDETWIYDDACNAWTRVEGDAPSPSGRHMAAWADGQVWIFGGRYRAESATGHYTLYDDLFRFDVAARSWHSVEVRGERPAARVSGALVWDGARRRLWLFGGNTSASGAAYVPLDDLWSFDPAAERWTRHDVAGERPSPRLFHAALYDAERDTFVIYGGTDASAFSDTVRYFGDVWALDLGAMRWRRLHAGGAGAPAGRFWAGLVHDTRTDAYLLFGGHDDGALGNRDDTWRFDPDALAWTLVSEGDAWKKPARGFCDFPPDFADVDLAAPERRSAHSLAWSEGCGHALVFGGKTDCGAIDDVWALAGDSWTERVAATEGEACTRWRADPESCGDLCF